MALPGTYLVVCEGASEANYLAQLNRILATLPPPNGLWGRPLRFNLPILGEASCDKITEYAGRCVGNGKYSSMLKAWKKVVNDNPSTSKLLWCDWDLYARNDDGNMEAYQHKSARVPDFHFSFQNFEDFVAMHFEDDGFNAWIAEMAKKHHWRVPLHSESYLPLFEQYLPQYEKGCLPDDWLCLSRLNNMRRHITGIMHLNPRPISHYLIFADFISRTLHLFYPLYFP